MSFERKFGDKYGKILMVLQEKLEWMLQKLLTIQNNKSDLNYLIDPTFTKVSRLFVLSFTRSWNERFWRVNWWKKFFDLPVKNKEEAYEKNIEISRNNDYTTGNLLDFAYFKWYYRLITIDLGK